MKLDELTATAKDAITVKRVFGEPVERDGITVIPAATIAGGFGGGTGKAQKGDEGEGGGFGLAAKPAGVYLVANGNVTWKPAVDVNRLFSTVGAVLIAWLVARTVIVRSKERTLRRQAKGVTKA